MKQSLQCLLFVLSVATLLLVSTGCKNTAHGFGEDMENTGEKIQQKTQ